MWCAASIYSHQYRSTLGFPGSTVLLRLWEENSSGQIADMCITTLSIQVMLCLVVYLCQMPISEFPGSIQEPAGHTSRLSLNMSYGERKQVLFNLFKDCAH
jgi:hypothetical protein